MMTTHNLPLKSNYYLYKKIGCPLHTFENCIYTESKIPHPLLNGVLLGQPDDAQIEPFLTTILNHYQCLNLPFCFWSDAETETAKLKEALLAESFQLLGSFAGMIHNFDDLSQIKPTNLKIAFTQTETDLLAFSQTVCAVFQIQEVRQFANCLAQAKGALIHFFGTIDEKCVTTGSLLMVDGHAFIYNISTHENFRRKGYAESLIKELLHYAKEKGCCTAALIATPMAEALYTKVGFKKVSCFNLYIKI